MSEAVNSSEDLRRIYEARFAGKSSYRQSLWKTLSLFFRQWISSDAVVLDLGCGYCEFINAIRCGQKFAMDLNPDAQRFADSSVCLLQQDCSEPWHLNPETLDVVFTSNFFEHLPTKGLLERTLQEAHRALKPGGRLIAMGPNIRYLPGSYWDFFDHYLALTDLSLIEVLRKCRFEIEVAQPKFLPYTMSRGRSYPIWMLKFYLSIPLAWRVFGKQFLIVARKPLT